MALIGTRSKTDPNGVPADLAPYYREPSAEEISARQGELYFSTGPATFAQAAERLHLERLDQARRAKTEADLHNANEVASRCLICGEPWSQPYPWGRVCEAHAEAVKQRIAERRMDMLTETQRRTCTDLADRYLANPTP